jgi:hypothetical protein
MTELGDRGSWCSVYDGRRCCGHLVSRGRDGVEAFDINDRSIGIFASQSEAAAAIWRRARGQAGERAR